MGSVQHLRRSAYPVGCERVVARGAATSHLRRANIEPLDRRKAAVAMRESLWVTITTSGRAAPWRSQACSASGVAPHRVRAVGDHRFGFAEQDLAFSAEGYV